MKGIRGISVKLFAICFLFLLSSISLVSMLSYRAVQSEMLNQEIEHSEQLLSKVKQNLDLYFLLMQNTLLDVYYAAPSWGGDESIAQDHLENLYEVNASYANNIYLIKSDLSIIGGMFLTRIFNDPEKERQVLYAEGVANRMTSFVSSPYRSRYSDWTVTMLRQVPWTNSEPVIAAMDLNLSAIEERMFQVSGQEALAISILDSKGQIVVGVPATSGFVMTGERSFMIGEMTSETIAGSHVNRFRTVDSNGVPILIMTQRMDKVNWTVSTVVKEVQLLESFSRLRETYVMLVIAGFILSLIAALLIARYIRNPVFHLIRKMSLVKQGDLDVSVVNHRSDEFGELAQTFDSMLDQIRLLISNLNESETMKRKLEVQALQSQINPHFLYNTLGAISNAVILQRYDKVDPVIEALISIFEYGISDVSDEVTLQQELDNIYDYLFIQETRYGRSFHLNLYIEENLTNARVLRMFLQPLVENSLFHGYQGGTIAGDIRITARKENKKLIVDVQDDGIGMTKERLASLLEPTPESAMTGNRKRIGLYNIHQRIRLNYGSEYRLKVISESESGTTVTAVFPHKIGYLYN